MKSKWIFPFIAFLVFSAFAFWRWADKRKACCGNQPAAAAVTSNTPAAPSGAASLPLSFAWNGADAVQGNGYDAWQKEQVKNLGPSDTLVITTWYYSGETGARDLALQRAEKMKALFAGIAGSRIKVVTDSLARTADEAYKTSRFEAAGFSVAQKQNSLVKKLDNRILIYFASNSSAKQLEKEVDDYLTTLAAEMKNDTRRVTATGYTDNVGDDAKNLALSLRRAEFVRTALLAKGVDSSRVSAAGKGEADPLAGNDTEEGRKQNRRVELIIN